MDTTTAGGNPAEEGKEMKKMKISRSKSGLPCISVGGGAYSNTFSCRFVVRGEKLARAIFVKSSGHLACSHDQAIVPIQAGDIVVFMEGHLPFEQNNPDISIEAFVAKDITQEGDIEYVLLTPTKYSIPKEIWSYLSRGIKYHNRNGEYFCIPPINKKV